MILRPGDLVERTGAKMHRGQAGGSTFFFLITKLMMICDYEPPHFLQVGHLHQIISLKTWVSETNEKWGNFHDPSYSNWYDMRIPANFFLVKFVRYLPCHGREFPKISQRRPKIPDDFPNVAENVRRCSGELWPLPKPFKRRQFTRVSILLGHKVIIQSSYWNIFVEFELNFRD